MNFEMTDKLQAFSNAAGVSGNEAAGMAKGEDTGFLELASAKLAQKISDPADSAPRSVWERQEDPEPYAYYERFRRKERYSEIARQEKRRFKLEQEAKRKRRAQYVKILNESALKRRLREQESRGRYYTSCTIRKIAITSCDSGSVSIPVSKESIALLLADRELVQKEAELAEATVSKRKEHDFREFSKRNIYK